MRGDILSSRDQCRCCPDLAQAARSAAGGGACAAAILAGGASREGRCGGGPGAAGPCQGSECHKHSSHVPSSFLGPEHPCTACSTTNGLTLRPCASPVTCACRPSWRRRPAQRSRPRRCVSRCRLPTRSCRRCGRSWRTRPETRLPRGGRPRRRRRTPTVRSRRRARALRRRPPPRRSCQRRKRSWQRRGVSWRPAGTAKLRFPRRRTASAHGQVRSQARPGTGLAGLAMRPGRTYPCHCCALLTPGL
jgi:hypothetical protein